MTKNNKIKIIIGFGLIGICSLIICLLLVFSKDENVNNSTSNNVNISNEKFDKEKYATLGDRQTIFNIETIINDFNHQLYFAPSNCYDMLNNNYIFDQKITKDNLRSKLNPNNFEKTFYYENGYKLKKDNLIYYFVIGYEINYSMASESTTTNENIKYMIALSGGKFLINPILNDNDLVTNIKAYSYLENKSDFKTQFKSYNSSDYNDASYYYIKFLNLLYNNPKIAYSLLDKEMYLNYESFILNIDNLYKSLSSQIFAYSKEEKNGLTVYKIIDQNQNSIVITENKPMDITVKFEIK